MRILVVGATGRTGRLVVERALGHGHDITALARSAYPSAGDARVTVVTGDATDFEVLSAAMYGVTAVVVAVGGSARGLHESVVANVIHAMTEQGVSRLAVLSAAGTFARNDPNLSLALRLMITTALRSTYEELEAMERRVMASDLDWAIVRPFGLTDAPPSGDYRISLDGSLLPKASRISRADVAAVLLKALETVTYQRKAVVIGD